MLKNQQENKWDLPLLSGRARCPWQWLSVSSREVEICATTSGSCHHSSPCGSLHLSNPTWTTARHHRWNRSCRQREVQCTGIRCPRHVLGSSWYLRPATTLSFGFLSEKSTFRRRRQNRTSQSCTSRRIGEEKTPSLRLPTASRKCSDVHLPLWSGIPDPGGLSEGCLCHRRTQFPWPCCRLEDKFCSVSSHSFH